MPSSRKATAMSGEASGSVPAARLSRDLQGWPYGEVGAVQGHCGRTVHPGTHESPLWTHSGEGPQHQRAAGPQGSSPVAVTLPRALDRWKPLCGSLRASAWALHPREAPISMQPGQAPAWGCTEMPITP